MALPEIGDDLNFAPCGFLIFEEDGNITNINQTLIELLAYGSREELIGSNIETLFTVAGRIFYQTHFYPLVNLHGRANEIFFTLKARNNTRLPVICNAVRKRSGDRITIHCVIVPVKERGKYEEELLQARRRAEEALEKNEAITEAKKQLEQHSISLDRKISQLRQINDDIAQFSKTASHDLQEPIRRIAVLADKIAVQSKELLSPGALLELNKINTECRNLRQLVAKIERFISLNTITEEYTSISIENIFYDAIREAKKLAAIEIDFEINELPIIEGFEKQIQLLLFNIIDNCVKFRKADTPLKIKVAATTAERNTYRTIKDKYRYTESLNLTIEDNGIGFDLGPSDNIFQLQKRISGGSNGLGFGLALCKKIVDNHFGSIKLASKIGQGTIITILLPLNQQIDF